MGRIRDRVYDSAWENIAIFVLPRIIVCFAMLIIWPILGIAHLWHWVRGRNGKKG